MMDSNTSWLIWTSRNRNLDTLPMISYSIDIQGQESSDKKIHLMPFKINKIIMEIIYTLPSLHGTFFKLKCLVLP